MGSSSLARATSRWCPFPRARESVSPLPRSVTRGLPIATRVPATINIPWSLVSTKPSQNQQSLSRKELFGNNFDKIRKVVNKIRIPAKRSRLLAKSLFGLGASKKTLQFLVAGKDRSL